MLNKTKKQLFSADGRLLDTEILRLAIPGIVTNITVPLLGWVDLMLAGRAVIADSGQSAAQFVGAVALGSMLFNVMYWLLGFLRMSTSGLTAQAYGAKDVFRIKLLFKQSIVIALIVSLLLILLQVPIFRLMYLIMGASDDVWSMVKTYFGICIWGAPAVLGSYSLTGWFIGIQDTRTPMIVSISQNVVNIVCSLLFVVGLHMKIEGVALGTLIAQWVGLLIGLMFFKEKSRKLPSAHSTLSSLRFQLSAFLSVSRDIFLRTFCLVAVNLWFVSAGARQGDNILAANALLMTLFTLFSYVLDGFANAGEALSGRYYGNIKTLPEKSDGSRMLQRVIIRLYLWGIVMAVLFTLVYLITGVSILRLFTDSTDVLEAARPYLAWAILVPLAGFAAFVADGICIGLTRTRLMLVASALATLVFFLVSLSPTMFSFGLLSANHALWLALILYLFIRSIVQSVKLINPLK